MARARRLESCLAPTLHLVSDEAGLLAVKPRGKPNLLGNVADLPIFFFHSWPPQKGNFQGYCYARYKAREVCLQVKGFGSRTDSVILRCDGHERRDEK